MNVLLEDISKRIRNVSIMLAMFMNVVKIDILLYKE